MIRAEGAWKRFRLRRRSLRDLAQDLLPGARRGMENLRLPFWALRDVSIDVEPGAAHAVVGENGSGKSTLLKLMSGMMRPTRGTVTVADGAVLLSHLGSGFHPELSGRENVFLQGAILGIPKQRLSAKLDEIVSFAEVERFIDVPVKFYSSGMAVRLAFAIAACLDPEILLIDEALAVGDTAFRDRCLERILEFRAAGVTMVIVSHDRYLVEQLCDRAWLLHRGEMVESGDPASVFNAYERVVKRDHPDRANPTIEGDPGRSPLAIESVTLLGHDGHVEPILDVDQPLTVRIAARATRDVRGAAVGVQIARDWHVLHGTRSTRQGVEISAERGQLVTLDLEYERLGLSSGGYSLHVSVLEHRLAHDPILRVKRAARLRVTHSESEGVGLVRLPHTWRECRVRVQPGPGRS